MDAVVDTSVLTDVLLKPSIREQALMALASFGATHLPEYALKEFREGPLHYFVWAHNRIAADGSLAALLGSLASMARTPRRYLTSTAAEAFREAAIQFKAEHKTLGKMVEKYGEDADPDKVIADRFLIALRSLILKAWKKRKKLTSSVIGALPCFQEQAPFLDVSGTISLAGPACNRTLPCAMADIMRSDLPRTRRMLSALTSGAAPEKHETEKRVEVLKLICQKRSPEVPHKLCRAIGDAAFAFLCPAGGVMLTTNARDHMPLADAVGVSVITPTEAAPS